MCRSQVTEKVHHRKIPLRPQVKTDRFLLYISNVYLDNYIILVILMFFHTENLCQYYHITVEFAELLSTFKHSLKTELFDVACLQ